MINFGIFSGLVTYVGFFMLHPILALAVGAAVSLVFTFGMSKHAVFATSV